MRPIVLSVAGSDPSAGAGVQADLKTVEACGGYGVTALTCVTVQNTLGVRRVQALEAEIVSEQVGALFEDLDVAAVKTGMLGSPEIVGALARLLRGHPSRPCVVDPVLRSSGGQALNTGAILEAMTRELAPLATLVTPNLDEAAEMSGVEVRGADDARQAGRRLLDQGWRAVLVTGGHARSPIATDLLVTRDGVRSFESPRLETADTHGTGCVHASALATALAGGQTLEQAAATAKEFVTGCIRAGLRLGHGAGPVDALHVWHESRRRMAIGVSGT